VQQKELGLKKAWGSPNGAMRRGWNGITISRDTIHIDGMELGFKKPVLFERHAVGGEYGAGWKMVGKGRLVTKFYPNDKYGEAVTVDERVLNDDHNVAVVYHNPYDNIKDLAHHFFKRCLEAGVTPYVVTKKTVFKWQEGFWTIMKDVFDQYYRTAYQRVGLLKRSNGELPHLISDAATMQIIRWTEGGFGMAAHNYDGDMLTDEVAQVHRSPGFITSNLIGKRDDGVAIMEFEASHGTVADLWHLHLAGKETSFNPLGMAEALMSAMRHAADLDSKHKAFIYNYTDMLRAAMHRTMVYGQGTRDLCGPDGLTTEDFIDKVAWRLDRYLKMGSDEAEQARTAPVKPSRRLRRNFSVVDEEVRARAQCRRAARWRPRSPRACAARADPCEAARAPTGRRRRAAPHAFRRSRKCSSRTTPTRAARSTWPNSPRWCCSSESRPRSSTRARSWRARARRRCAERARAL
jgi:isocitrate dehydrogenase